MTPSQARGTAREILGIVPVVMRAVAAELRAAGELPAPAHYGLLTLLCSQPRTLSELAELQGVSLPTMSNSISAMEQRGWVRRTAPVRDRRVVIVDVTPTGRAALDRVGKCAEGHLAQRLAALTPEAGRRLRSGLGVLRVAFAAGPLPRRRPAARRSARALA
jgi:DNA-binding MarR family transcriptional regulator